MVDMVDMVEVVVVVDMVVIISVFSVFSYCRAHDDRVPLEQYRVLRELSARDEVECA